MCVTIDTLKSFLGLCCHYRPNVSPLPAGRQGQGFHGNYAIDNCY